MKFSWVNIAAFGILLGAARGFNMAPLIGKHKKIFIFVSAVVTAAAFFYPAKSTCAQGLTGEEKAKLERCVTGISGLNPKIAEECLKNGWLEQKTAKNSDGLKILQTAYALKDYSELIDAHEDHLSLYHALSYRMYSSKMQDATGFQRDEDKLLNWVEKYKGKAKTGLTRQALRSWDTLDEFERGWLAQKNINASAWKTLPLGKRAEYISEYAQSEAEKIFRNPSGALYEHGAVENIEKKIKSLQDNIRPSDPIWNRLEGYKRKMQAFFTARDEAQKKLSKKKLQKFFDIDKNLKNLPLDESITALNGFFDNDDRLKTTLSAKSLRNVENLKKPDSGIKDLGLITDMLETAIKSEIKGTIAGDRFLALEKQWGRYKINFSPDARLPHYDYKTDEVVFPVKEFHSWLKNSGYAEKDLILNKEALKKMARSFSGTFIHETKHREQFKWAESRKIPWVYIYEQEEEAVNAAASYLAERSEKDPQFAELIGYRNEKKKDSLGELCALFKTDRKELNKQTRLASASVAVSFEALSAYFSSLSSEISAEIEKRKKSSTAEESDMEKARANHLPPATVIMEIKYLKNLEGIIPEIKTADLKNLKNYFQRAISEYGGRKEEEQFWVESTRSKIYSEGSDSTHGQIVPVPPFPAQ